MVGYSLQKLFGNVAYGVLSAIYPKKAWQRLDGKALVQEFR
jgi:hypothetical protein